MNNNIFLSNDPLLYNSRQYDQTIPNPNDYYTQLYKQQLINEQTSQSNDWIGNLDSELKELDPAIAKSLQENTEYVKLSQEMSTIVQQELMYLIKSRLNNNLSLIENIKRQQQIIKDAKNEVKEEDRKNMAELTDYMKNYSHLTFDEYKNIKKQNINVENEN